MNNYFEVLRERYIKMQVTLLDHHLRIAGYKKAEGNVEYF